MFHIHSTNVHVIHSLTGAGLVTRYVMESCHISSDTLSHFHFLGMVKREPSVIIFMYLCVVVWGKIYGQ